MILWEGEAPAEPFRISSLPPIGSGGASPSRVSSQVSLARGQRSDQGVRCDKVPVLLAEHPHSIPQFFEYEYDDEDDIQRRYIHGEFHAEACVPFAS